MNDPNQDYITIIAAECFPTNDLLTSAITPAFNLIIGSVYSVITTIILVAVLIIVALMAIIKIIRSKEAKEDIGALAWVGLVIPALIVIYIVTTVLIGALQNACPE